MPCDFVVRAAGAFDSRSASSPSSLSPNRRPTIRPTARAVPPTASAAWGRGGSSSPSRTGISRRARSSCFRDGGSPPRNARVTRSAPASTERTQVGTSVGRPDGDFARPPAEVHDGDRCGRIVHARDRALPRKPAFVVGGEDHDGGLGRVREDVDQLGGVGGLPTRRRDDRLQPVGALLPRSPSKPSRDFARLLELRTADLAERVRVVSEPDVDTIAMQLFHASLPHGGHHETNRVRSDVDDRNLHGLHCRRGVGWASWHGAGGARARGRGASSSPGASAAWHRRPG